MTKLHKKKANIFGKKVPVLLLMAIVAVGIASAALLPYFGQITGLAVVEQSVTLDGESYDDSELTGTWDETFVAGKTFTEEHTLENNADESVDLSIGSDCSADSHTGSDQCDGITTGVYEVQTYDLVGQNYGDTDEHGTKDDAVEVVPGVDEVTYRIDFSGDSEEVDLEISREDGDNYHVKYDGEDFKYKDPSTSEDLEDAENLEEFKEGSYDDGVVEITVERETGYDQSFSVHLMGDFDEADSYVTQTAFDEDTQGGGQAFYDDESTEHHEEIDFEEFSDLTLGPGESFDFSLSNRFAINLVPDDYTITTTVDMAE